MNLDVILPAIVAISVGLLIMMLVILYLQHKAARALRRFQNESPKQEGKLFHPPMTLESKYPVPPSRPEKSKASARTSLKKFLFPALVFSTALVLVGAFYVQKARHELNKVRHENLELKTQDLTQKKETMNHIEPSSQWKAQTDSAQILLEELLTEIKERKIIFIYNKSDEKWKASNKLTSPTKKIVTSWKKWAARNDISTQEAEWKSLKTFYAQTSNSLFIIPSGLWDFVVIEKLMAKKASILLVGPPLQIYDKKRKKALSFKNLNFKKNENSIQNWFIVKSDQPLTLGLNGGTKYNLPPISSSYLMTSKKPDAIGVSTDDSIVPSRLDTIPDKKARVVWADFIPDGSFSSKTIQAQIFRYLLKKNYSSVSTWPHNKLFAVATVINTMGHLKDTNAISTFPSPISWIVDPNELIREAQSNSIFQSKDEIICALSEHFPSTTEIMSEFHKSLQPCTAIQNRTAAPVKGGYLKSTPDPRLMDVSLKNQWNFFVLATAQKTPFPQIFVSDKKEIFSQFGFFKSMGPEISEKILESQIKHQRQVGSLLLFQLSQRTFLKVASSISNAFKKPDPSIFMASMSELTHWWSVRAKAIEGISIDAADIEKYQPRRLTLDDHGEVVASEILKSELSLSSLTPTPRDPPNGETQK